MDEPKKNGHANAHEDNPRFEVGSVDTPTADEGNDSSKKLKAEGANSKNKSNSDIHTSPSGNQLQLPKENKNGMKKSASRANDLSSNYKEHHWDLNKIVSEHPDSRIDAENPDKSQGLTKEKAAQLLEKNGPNKLPAPEEISDLRLFLSQFANLLWGLLFGAATLSLVGFFLGKMEDYATLWVSIILYVMIVVMCFISFWQEREARKVVKGFEGLLPQNCNVIRDGNESGIAAENLVVGDLIRIKSGTRVPADSRILKCSELKLETSAITGESEPVEYQPDAVKSDVIIFESRNVAFNGSMCVDGEATALVIKTASDTIIGQIASMTTNQSNKASRLEYQIKIFVKFLTVVAFIVGLIAFIIGGFNTGWKSIVKLLVTSFTVCAVAMIPEGLPATVTSILTLVARRLASKNVYLKRLDIVEALGSANIIASDKTGTLTKNEMIVVDLWYSNEYISDIPENKITGNQRTMTVKTISKVDHPLSDLLVAMTICNKASFENEKGQMPKSERDVTSSVSLSDSQAKCSTATRGTKRASKVQIEMPTVEEEPKQSSRISSALSSLGGGANSNSNTITQNTVQRRRRRRIELIQGMRAIGPPSEVAMIKYAEQLINVHDFRRRYNVIFEIPFNSKRKYHLVIAKIQSIGSNKTRYLLLIKGAPEIIIKRCTKILGSDGEVELNEDRMNEFQSAYQTYGEHGRRVIGFAHLSFVDDADKKFDADQNNFPFEDLTFLGVCAIMDPPRDETANAIRQCKEAGIKVFMVTGDHHITAAAIAQQIGLTGGKLEDGSDDYEVIKGEDISKLSDDDWDRLVSRRALVFARTTPEQKYRIVEECEKRDQIIAMTGDGVNDAPALKKADIGVGMGSGSDVAKQAADIVLVDDNFSSMVKAVEEGRLMFDNIKKLMVYILTHAFPELWALFVHYLFGMPIGITTLQILSIDLGTEILPGIALCKEPLEGDVMKRPPRKTGKTLIGKALIGYCYGYTAHVQALGCFLAYMSVFWSHGFCLGDLWMSQDHFLDSWEDKNATEIASLTLITCQKNVYTLKQQDDIAREARSAWQIGIVLGQIFHIFSARSLRVSMFYHGFFSNRLMIFAVIAEIVLLLIFIYVPAVNYWLGGKATNYWPWIIVSAFGIFIFAYNELRKYCCRRWPYNKIVRIFKF